MKRRHCWKKSEGKSTEKERKGGAIRKKKRKRKNRRDKTKGEGKIEEKKKREREKKTRYCSYNEDKSEVCPKCGLL